MILSLFSFLFIGVFVIENIKDDLKQERTDIMISDGVNLIRNIKIFHKVNHKNVKHYVDEYKKRYDNSRVLLLDDVGFLIHEAMVKFPIRTKVKFNIEEFQRISKDNQDCFYHIKNYEIRLLFKIEKSDGLVGYVYVERNLDEVESKINRMQKTMFYISLLDLILVSFFSIVIAKNMTYPIEKLEQGFKSLSRGDFYEKIKIEANDELSSLCKSFNIMNTKITQIETQRKEFVSNVCHELKTPLSSIKVLIGSLIYSDFDKSIQKEFLIDMDGEIDRLNMIIDDLKVLVDIDEDKLKLNFEMTYLNYIIEKIIDRLKFKWEEKNIKIRYHEYNKVQMNLDQIKIDRVITNILDNAIKYSEENSMIDIYIYYENDYAIIKVKDRGIGITEDDIQRIFERFYRVDKARSRETGGSGLGLCIAKQIIELHQGDIIVKSKENFGTSIYIKLPKALI
ncbi:MAG: cell wall metabolism sensor histidine kinase WalK [Peptostreptococcaceae bacterium]|nr:cell wall metabolism sensor histidine kinase WalK [Peptostreptococcaceae bacterium]